MELIRFIFHFYLLLGILIIIFNGRISSFFYNLVLLYTNQMNLKDIFLFKVNRKNADSLFSVARYFTITLGLMIIVTSLYFIYSLGMSFLF
ncbi:MAG: hypothetical protein ACOC16_04165 [Nanoarchaeota archaeon]